MILAPLLLLFQVTTEVPLDPLPIPPVKHAAPIEIAPPPEPSFDDARLEQCIKQAASDPATAIATANQWAGEAIGENAAYPQQCLGHAYTSLLRWDAAERAFLAARESLGDTANEWRARLAIQAANAAMAENRAEAALFDLDLATRDLGDADPAVASVIATDRARALVASGKEADAEAVLAQARSLDAQSPYAWLLSATLARRLGKLADAQTYIQTAAKLAPTYPEIGLEAGVIAMLAGDENAARASWQAVVKLAPEEEAGTSAKAYLAQLDELDRPTP